MVNKIEENIRRFLSGDEMRAYEWLGCNKMGEKLVFRVWAPGADEVYLAGDFNSWGESCPMSPVGGGVWELTLKDNVLDEGKLYKYKIYKDERSYFRSDPYSYSLDVPPHCASVISDLRGYRWHDKGWMAQRDETAAVEIASQPLNVYELHLGSWMRRGDGSFLSYSEIAEELAPYVKQMGYTHVELLPVASHPFYGSWGYQTGGYFAPDSRFGEAKGFMTFVDVMHRAGVGVILDLTFSSFPKDEFGLYEFDGSHLYERDNGDEGEALFDMSSPCVCSFLLSNAVYWLEKYHVDGLRFCDMASVLLRDGKKDFDACEFFKKLNCTVKEIFSGVFTVGDCACSASLGFDLLWDNRWTEDFLRYASIEHKNRGESHRLIADAVNRAASGDSLLAVSHDCVSGGKGSFVEKMPGDYWQKFAGARAFEALRMTSPGKKLAFMGSEIAQFCEWTHEKEVEWFLLDYESHDRHQLYLSDLNSFYLSHPELWQREGADGFKWIDENDAEKSVVSFRRIADNSHELIIVINLTPKTYDDYFLPVPTDGFYEEVFNSDDLRYGGSGVVNKDVRFSSRPNPEPLNGKAAESILPYALRLRLPPLGVTIMKLVERKFDDGEGDVAEEKFQPQRRGIRKLSPPRKKLFL